MKPRRPSRAPGSPSRRPGAVRSVPSASSWPKLGWKLGVEVELLAPRGKTRRDLAEALAKETGGKVQVDLHRDSEPSKVPGMKVFWNLTPAFNVLDRKGRRGFRLVDDLTLQDDLDLHAPPLPGWYRIVSDDLRLLGLAQRHTVAGASIARSLIPLGKLFGTRPQALPSGMFRLSDSSGASIAMTLPLPGERHRSCEVITAPLVKDHGAQLESLLGTARAQGFLIPQEGAVHLHFDGAPLRSAATVRNLVALLHPYRALLKALVKTNPRCRRLGPWPDALLTLVRQPGFTSLPWEKAREALLGTGLQKYCDFNLMNFIRGVPGKETLEVRILPVHLETQPILDAARLFEAILRRAERPVKFRQDAGETAAEALRLFKEIALPQDVTGRYLQVLRGSSPAALPAA